MNSIPHTADYSRDGDRQSDATTRNNTVYLASPLATYYTERYNHMLEAVRRHFPDSEILPARNLYHDNEHWRATWPVHLKRISAVAFFSDTDGTIGKGVYQEVWDATVRSIPVRYLQDDGTLLPDDQVELALIDDGDDWRKFAMVRVKLPLRTKKQAPKRIKREADDGQA